MAGSLLLAAGTVSPAQAQSSATPTAAAPFHCEGMRLISTRGVPEGPARRYAFRGTCRITHDGRMERVAVEAAGNWDETSREAIEVLEPVVGWGSVRSVFRCREDPWLALAAAQPDGQAASSGGGSIPDEASVPCELLQHTNTTGWEAFGAGGSRTGPPGPVTGRRASPARPDGSAGSVASSPPPASLAEGEPVSGAEMALVERVAAAPRSAAGLPDAAVARLAEVAALLAADRRDEAIPAWRELLGAGPVGGAAATATDVDALATRVLRAAYLEPDEELRDQADRLRYYREQEEQARALISELRREGSTGAGSQDAELRRMEARVVQVRRQAREAAAGLRTSIGRRPDLRDRIQEEWKALRGAAKR